MKKKLISILLTLAMAFNTLPTTVFAATGTTSKTVKETVKDDITLTKSAEWNGESRTEATVTLTVKGEERAIPTTSPANIMLVLDTTGSMGVGANSSIIGRAEADIDCPATEAEHLSSAATFGGQQVYICPINGKTYSSLANHDKVSRLQAVQYESKKYIDALLPDGGSNMVSVISFSDAISVQYKEAGNPSWTSDANELKDFIDNDGNYDGMGTGNMNINAPMYPMGSTEYNIGFSSAVNFVKNLPPDRANYQTFVVFLSDGEPDGNNDPRYNGKAESAELRALQTGGTNVRVLGIAFSGKANSSDVDGKGSIRAALENVVSQPAEKNIWLSGGSDTTLGEVLDQIRAITETTYYPAGKNLTLTDTISDDFVIDTTKNITYSDGTPVPDDAITVSGQTVTWKFDATTTMGQSIIIPIKLASSKSVVAEVPTNKGNAILRYTPIDKDGAPWNETTMGVESPLLEIVVTAEKATLDYNLNLADNVIAGAGLKSIDPETIPANTPYDITKIPTDKSDTPVTSFTFEGTTYTFKGWSTTADGSYIVKKVSVTANKTGNLFAAWDKVALPKDFKITFDPNGGTITSANDGATADGSKWVYDVTEGDTNFTKTLVAEKTDKTFHGWSTDPNAVYNGDNVQKTITIATIGGSATYYAIYGPVEKTVNVTYYVQNPDGTYTAVTAPTGKDKIETSIGGSFIIEDALETDISKIVANATHFDTVTVLDKNGTTKPTDGKTLTGNVTFGTDTSSTDFGVYVNRKAYSVTITGGTQAADSPLAESSVSYTSNQPKAGEKVIATINGKATDAGLSVTDNADGTKTVSGNITNNADIVFTYVKDDEQYFKVLYKSGYNDTTQVSKEVLKGQSIDVIADDDVQNIFPTSGYTFKEWTTRATDFLKDGKVTVPVGDQTSVVVLTANWKADVTFEVQDGTFGDTTDSTKTVTFTNPGTDTITVPDNMKPTNDSDKSTGKWYLAGTDGKPSGDPIDPSISDGSKFIFVFDQKGTFDITFNIASENAAHFNEDTTMYTINETAYQGDPYKGTFPTVTLKDSGWKQADWVVTVDNVTQTDVKTTDELKSLLAQPITGNVKATAKFTATVTLDPNGGTLAPDQDTELNIPDGDKLPTIQDPTIENGPEFEGWFDENGNKFIPGETVITAPIVLIAQYGGLNITKTHTNPENKADGNLRVGDKITYTVTVTNTGTRALTNLSLSDTMFNGLAQDIKLNDSAVSPINGKLEIASIDAKSTATVTYTYTVAEGDVGKAIKNTAIVKHGDTEKEVDHTTGSTEQKYELLFNYNYEQFINDGKNVALNGGGFAQNKAIIKEYAGVEISADAITTAINTAMAGANIPTGHVSDYSFWRGDSDGNYTAPTPVAPVTLSTSPNANHIKITYALQRYTLTYNQGDGTKGTIAPQADSNGVQQADGSILFENLPYGVVLNKWFGSDAGHGSLEPTTTPIGENGFYRWLVDGSSASYIDTLASELKGNVSFTPDWRSSVASYKVEMYTEGSTNAFHTFNLVTPIDIGATSTTTTLDGEELLTSARLQGATISQGYKFSNFDPTPTENGMEVLADGTTVIKAYYKPYDLAVWHKLGNTMLFDAAQSKAVVETNTSINADATKFTGRVRYASTAVTIDGTPSTGSYGSRVTIAPNTGAYVVTFAYSTYTDGGNTGGGGGGENATEKPKDIFIPEPDVPLAGLDTINHFAYIVGYPDGGIHPNAQINRQETATIFFRLLDETSRTSNLDASVRYTDTWSALWSNKAISTMTNANIVAGYPDGTFRPDAPITRGEFAAMAARFDSVDYQGENKFSDINGHWAATQINRAAEKGWITGYEDGTFRPDEYITRAEAITLVNNVLNRKVKSDGMLEGMNTWNDCAPTDWFYLAVQEATNSHDYTRETFVSDEAWVALNPARDWKSLEQGQ